MASVAANALQREHIKNPNETRTADTKEGPFHWIRATAPDFELEDGDEADPDADPVPLICFARL